jgi:hypothetical protein
MGELQIDMLSRRAGEIISRRGTLLALGGAALAAVASKNAVRAGKSGKKKRQNRKKAKGQALTLCKPQVGECQEFLAANCSSGGEICAEISAFCCPLLGTCQSAEFLTCLVERSTPDPAEAGV